MPLASFRSVTLGIADAETNHARVAQVHGVDAAEVFLLLIIETLLGACDRGRADHIDEAISMLVDKADALFAGLWGDKHDDAQVVLVGNGLHNVLIVIKGKVWDDSSADTCLYATLTNSDRTPRCRSAV